MKPEYYSMVNKKMPFFLKVHTEVYVMVYETCSKTFKKK